MLVTKNIRDDKKNIEKPKKKIWRKVLLIIGAILLFFLLVFGYIYANAAAQLKEMGLNASPAEIISFILRGLTTDKSGQPTFSITQTIGINSTPELKRDSTDTYTNILLIGVDTRPDDYGYLNTDTLIIASYNYDNQQDLILKLCKKH